MENMAEGGETSQENEYGVLSKIHENEMFVEKIGNEYKCAICLSLLKDPRQLIGCGHLFCQICITNYFESDLKAITCPLDRSSASLHDLIVPPKAVNNTIELFREKHFKFEDICTARFKLSELNVMGVISRFHPCTSLTALSTPLPAEKLNVEIVFVPTIIFVKLEDQSKTVVIKVLVEEQTLILKRITRENGSGMQSLVIQYGRQQLNITKRLVVEYNTRDGSVEFSLRPLNT